MRQGPHNKRGRGRGGNNNRRSGTPNRNQTFDSNGPDVRIRGNASQVHEKYMNLARDAAQNGDRVLAESYFQHAEHYYRILSAFNEEAGGDANRNRGNGAQQNPGEDQQTSQFQEGEPQPELNLASGDVAAAPAPRPRDEAPSRPEPLVEGRAPEPIVESVTSSAPPAAAEASDAPVDPRDDSVEAPRPARRPLSLRRRRPAASDDTASDRGEDRPAKTPSEPASSGVTVTVVGAPTVEAAEPAPPPRPRRRTRAAAAPVQPEETPGD